MPAEFEKLRDKITAFANKKYPKWSSARKKGYVYGTLAKMGWKKGKDGHMHKQM